MLSTPSEMLSSVRDWLNEPSAAFWSDNDLMKRLHDAQQDLVRVASEASPSLFVATYDISLVTDQDLYDLPLNARLGTRWIAVENRISGTPYFYVYDTDLRRHLDVEQQSWPWQSGGTPHMSMQGDQVRITPTPKESTSNGIRYMYNPSYGNMIQGTLTATTTTTLPLGWSASPNYVTTYGVVDNRDDYYNGMEVYVVSGTGAGQSRTISDYAGSTGVISVSTAFTAISTTDSVVAVMSPVPEDMREVQVLSAARMASAKGSRVHNVISNEYYGSPGRPGRYHAFQAWLEERQDWRGPTVEAYGQGF